MAHAKRPRVGVLAVQGAFALHRAHVEAAGGNYVEVVGAQDFAALDGLILPGGESATMLKLIDILGLKNSLKNFMNAKPTWGICAGAILMAQKVLNPAQESFAALAIEVERNSYGRQGESSVEAVDGYHVAFIRAPRILKIGSRLQVLGQRNGSPTWVESDFLTATTFHPEINLNTPSPWHRRFVKRLA